MARHRVGSNQYKTRAGSADVPAAAGDLLAQAQGLNIEQRRVIAVNPSAPPETLARLAQDVDADVCQAAVAQNTATPDQVLEHDEDWVVRRLAANHPYCPPETLAQLAGDKDPRVREAALNNRALPEEYRQLLRIVG
jgi:hypothetical protein